MNGDGLKVRVILVGIGGATCSGKTTLAKQLQRALPNSVIVHQDDFAPPADKLPIHPTLKVQDWDTAPSAIDYPRLVYFLAHLKDTGNYPLDHKSHDHLNIQKEVPLSKDCTESWRKVFEEAEAKARNKGVKIVWGLVDGFLLYWDQAVVDLLDVRIFLRVPLSVLKQRRSERNGYFTAGDQLESSDNVLWKDPPGYWEKLVYPAYVDAHRHLFVGGDVENGSPIHPVGDDSREGLGRPERGVNGLILLEGLQINLEEQVERCCKILLNCLEQL